MFSRKYVGRDVRRYWKHGLDKRAQVLADCLKSLGISGRSVLEIGCGIGVLQAELVRSGAASATGLDASAASVEAAVEVAKRLGLDEKLEYRTLDFALQESEVEGADIVVMDRVICCYPNMEGLVGPAARHARHLCALVYPRYTWWMRLAGAVFNSWLVATRSPFRFFMRPASRVAEVMTSEGFLPVFDQSWRLWRIVVYQRARDSDDQTSPA